MAIPHAHGERESLSSFPYEPTNSITEAPPSWPSLTSPPPSPRPPQLHSKYYHIGFRSSRYGLWGDTHSAHNRSALKNYMYQTSWWLVSIWGNLISPLVRAVRLMPTTHGYIFSGPFVLYLMGCTSRLQLSDCTDTLTWNHYPWFKKKKKKQLCALHKLVWKFAISALTKISLRIW